jgi:hypothetical protein
VHHFGIMVVADMAAAVAVVVMSKAEDKVNKLNTMTFNLIFS